MTLNNVNIKGNRQDTFTSDQLDVLANFVKNSGVDFHLEGEIYVSEGACYEDTYDILTTRTNISLLNVVERYPRFSEPRFAEWLLLHTGIDTNHDGKISREEINSITGFNGAFYNNTFDYDIDLTQFVNYKTLNIAPVGQDAKTDFVNVTINGSLVLGNIQKINAGYTWRRGSGKMSITANKVIFNNLEEEQAFLAFLNGCDIGVLQLTGATTLYSYDGSQTINGETLYRENTFYINSFFARESSANTIGCLILDDANYFGNCVFRAMNNATVNTIIMNSDESIYSVGEFFSGVAINTFILSNATTPPSLQDRPSDNFNKLASDSVLYVPDDSISEYASNQYWRLFSQIRGVSSYNGEYKEYIKIK